MKKENQDETNHSEETPQALRPAHQRADSRHPNQNRALAAIQETAAKMRNVAEAKTKVRKRGKKEQAKHQKE